MRTLTGGTQVRWIARAYADKGTWCATDVQFPGAWGTGDTESEALDDLVDVIHDWCEVKRADGDDDIPGEWTASA